MRRALPPENQRVRRAIDSIDRSLDRLDGLIASARRLDEATADLVAEPRRSIDLQRLLGKLIERFGREDMEEVFLDMARGRARGLDSLGRKEAAS